MAKDDKIHIKLEICRDEASNKLMIMTHFDNNAPNFFKDNDGYFWMPTMEEKNLINEAFELMPASSMTPTPPKSTPKPPEKQEIPPPEEVKPEEPPMPDKKEETPPLEKTSESDAFEVTDEEPKTENPPADSNEEEKGFLVEADDKAIEDAIRKHGKSNEDESIVEADEQTIIEKVLSQKKKGKWSKGKR
jgi:hypothetical protein